MVFSGSTKYVQESTHDRVWHASRLGMLLIALLTYLDQRDDQVDKPDFEARRAGSFKS